MTMNGYIKGMFFNIRKGDNMDKKEFIICATSTENDFDKFKELMDCLIASLESEILNRINVNYMYKKQSECYIAYIHCYSEEDAEKIQKLFRIIRERMEQDYDQRINIEKNYSRRN